MISKTSAEITITNSMGINKITFTCYEWEKIKKIFLNLTGEELLDLQHMIKYPVKQ